MLERPPKKQPRGISVDPVLWDAFGAEAARRGMSASALIGLLVAEAIDNQPAALPAASTASGSEAMSQVSVATSMPAVRAELPVPIPGPSEARVLQPERKPSPGGPMPAPTDEHWETVYRMGLGFAAGILAFVGFLAAIPGNGIFAEKLALAILGKRGDGYGAGVMLLSRHAGEVDLTRYLLAITRIPANTDRLFTCKQAANKHKDYRDLE